MKLLCLDIETTGFLEPEPEHRIVEFYGSLIDLDTRASIDTLSLRIDPQRSMPAKAQAIHNISLADLIGCPTWDMVAPQIHAFMSAVDIFLAHNGAEFDLPFLNMEFKRVGLTPLSQPVFDTMLEGRGTTPDGRVPNLGAFCFAFDVPYDPALAHAADYDVNVMTAAFLKGLDWGAFTLPEIAKETLAA